MLLIPTLTYAILVATAPVVASPAPSAKTVPPKAELMAEATRKTIDAIVVERDDAKNSAERAVEQRNLAALIAALAIAAAVALGVRILRAPAVAKPDTSPALERKPSAELPAKSTTRILSITVRDPSTGSVQRERKEITVRNPRGGFTLLEVLIAVALLATATGFFAMNVSTIRSLQRTEHEVTVARELGRQLQERIMGAQWATLGTDHLDDGSKHQFVHGAWAWHRREHKPFCVDTDGAQMPPMTDDPNVADRHNLIKLGLLAGRPGLDNLRVWVEYYRSEAIETIATSAPTDLKNRWNKLIAPADADAVNKIPGDPVDQILPLSPSLFALTTTTNVVTEQTTLDEIAVRILIVWNASIGGERRHEIVFVRRQ